MYKKSIIDRYEEKRREIANQIAKENDEYILGNKTEELAEYYFQKEVFNPIIYDESKRVEIETVRNTKIIPAHLRDEFYRSLGDEVIDTEKLVVIIPIIPNKDIDEIWNLLENPFSLSGIPKIKINQDEIKFEIVSKDDKVFETNNEIVRKIRYIQNAIKERVTRINKNIIEENDKLKRRIHNSINSRKKVIQQNDERLKSILNEINIPLRIKNDIPFKKIDIKENPIIKRVKPTKSLLEEYILDREKVLLIIEILSLQGLQFEKTPKTYNKCLSEDDLRNILLVNLNSIFEGKATGETFSSKGKSDIYLNIDKGNILIMECKFWQGRVLFDSTINQLLGYLTWRNNFGVVINFVNRKNFSKVLESIPEYIKDHKSYKGSFERITDTHFKSYHSLLQDENKSVELHTLFFNLYSPK